MQRHRHYGVSDAPEERAEPIVSEEARDGLRETGGDGAEEAAAPALSEAKPPPSSGSKKAAGGDAGAGTGGKYSAFTWLAVLALLGVWSSVAVVYFDIVDYDSVIGKLRAYDADGDGDFDAEDAKVLLDDRKFKGSRRKQAPRRALRDADEDPDETEVNEDEIPEERTLRKNGTRELPGRDDALRAALREELNAVNEKTEARRVARVALSEIKTLLAEDDPGEETAWRLKMKTLEVTRETLKLEKERIGLERERMEVETRRMEVEREKMEWEKERRAREKAEKESVEREEAERQKADEGRLALDEATEERERLEKLEGERSAGEEGKERERLAGDGEHAAEGREKEAAEKERLVPESDRPAQGEEKERAPRLSRDEAARNRTQAERPDARKANATQAPEEKSRRAGGVTAGRREKVAVADKMAAGGKKK